MKALNCKLSLLLAISLLLFGSLGAQEVKKEIHKEFQTNKSSVVNFETKFGALVIENWDENKIIVDVTITSKHPDEAKAKKILDLLDVEFDVDGNEITIETKMDDKISKGYLSKDKKFNFLIVAKVPTGIEFNLYNNFGTVKIQELSGVVDIENSFGTLEIESLTGDDVVLEIGTGDVHIGQLSHGDVEVDVGSINIQQANVLDIEVSSGSIFIGTVNVLNAELGTGQLEIDRLKPSFKSIDIETSNGNIVLGIDKDAGFTFDGELSMGNIDYPSSMENMKKKRSNLSSSVAGTYGNGKSIINLEGSMGNIVLKLK
ncbi:MAG: DUF4097 family beta strand repeat protein [Bacteroidetes bacterium]|jgi:hypothetical protein|nr:DUF4097 family beta strand repeat protein [Bacteroidota bacterium]MBT4398332.1 DUF4097 family beta strand repeat protein [Bacteroidota bacterium]MBT4409953.1 DUF4097 family beta strand repeat protein [Bacteroidota bacterium]MBT5427449.1 DUF4097 family beta strand repeat protein [Bacteroidota bacterium]MBT7092163.1 DUF4097 family beta strand repeat protein [Bacteroidota bacterium]